MCVWGTTPEEAEQKADIVRTPKDYVDRSENLAHAFDARLCRVHDAGPGLIQLELVRADILAAPSRRCPSIPLRSFQPELAGQWAGVSGFSGARAGERA
jgi:hypothetical protein